MTAANGMLEPELWRACATPDEGAGGSAFLLNELRRFLWIQKAAAAWPCRKQKYSAHQPIVTRITGRNRFMSGEGVRAT